MKTITEILNIGSMDQINKDLFENVKQYGEQDNNNDSPKSVKSNCSSNVESTHKNKTSEAQLRVLKDIKKRIRKKLRKLQKNIMKITSNILNNIMKITRKL